MTKQAKILSEFIGAGKCQRYYRESVRASAELLLDYYKSDVAQEALKHVLHLPMSVGYNVYEKAVKDASDAILKEMELQIEKVPESQISPDIVPQRTARKTLGITNRQTLGNWIKRGHVTPHDVHGETWVSVEECQKWMNAPKTRKRVCV